MTNYDQESIQWVKSQNQLMVGARGPLCARLFLNFALDTEFLLDMQHVQSVNQFDLCQSIYIDNADGGSAVVVTIPSSGMRIVAKSGSQGWYNVVCPNPIRITFDCAGGSPVTVLLSNTAIPGAIWSAI